MTVSPHINKMAELTPRDDNRKRVSEILKRVDQLIKSRDYEQAQRETEHAKEIDPRNVYIDAYQERIAALLEQSKRDHEVQEARRLEEEKTQKKIDEERRREEAERQKKLAEERKRQEEELRRRRAEEELQRKLEEERQQEEVKHLQRLQEEELRLRREEEEIRRRVEEARRKQTEERSHREHHPARSAKKGEPPKVFVIDDDDKLLAILKSTIEEEDFEVFAFTTSDDAYKALKGETPDLIVSDINLETSTMGGFSFYEKVRELDHLQEVPFVFLSGLSDEVLVRTGKELGIDDYITKPFSDKHLLAVIKGKIKRYRQLKDRYKNS